MSGGISFGQAIGIIGGIPILRNGSGSSIEHLLIPKHLGIGNPGTASALQGMLSNVLTGGIGTLLQSPLGSALSPVLSSISNAVGQLGTSTASSNPYAPVVSALNSLSTSSSNLSALADNLVGVGSNASFPTQLDMIGHLSAIQSLGPSVPANLSAATALAPVHAASTLSSVAAPVQSIASQVLAGTMQVSDGVTAIQALQAELDAITNGSTTAISTVQSAQTAMCAAQCAAALLVGGSQDAIDAMMVAIRPDMLSAVQAMVSAHMEAIAVAAASQAKVAAALAAIMEAEAADAAQIADFAPFD